MFILAVKTGGEVSEVLLASKIKKSGSVASEGSVLMYTILFFTSRPVDFKSVGRVSMEFNFSGFYQSPAGETPEQSPPRASAVTMSVSFVIKSVVNI